MAACVLAFDPEGRLPIKESFGEFSDGDISVRIPLALNKVLGDFLGFPLAGYSGGLGLTDVALVVVEVPDFRAGSFEQGVIVSHVMIFGVSR